MNVPTLTFCLLELLTSQLKTSLLDGCVVAPKWKRLTQTERAYGTSEKTLVMRRQFCSYGILGIANSDFELPEG
jgi:hypothetical protein